MKVPFPIPTQINGSNYWRRADLKLWLSEARGDPASEPTDEDDCWINSQQLEEFFRFNNIVRFFVSRTEKNAEAPAVASSRSQNDFSTHVEPAAKLENVKSDVLLPSWLVLLWCEAIAFDKRCTHSACHVALVISCHCNRKTAEAFPGIAQISRLADVAHRTVTRSIQELERLGWLLIRRHPGHHISHHYVLACEGVPITAAGIAIKLRRKNQELMGKPKAAQAQESEVRA